MRTKLVFLPVMAVSLLATLAWAQPQTHQGELVAQLQAALDKCDWKVRTGAAPTGIMLLHQAKMRRILAELKAGQTVGMKDLEEVMKGHSS